MRRRSRWRCRAAASHGAFTWGVLDRLLEEVEAGRLEIAAISGASAGAINACVTASGLAEGGPALARTRLREFWQLRLRSAARGGQRAVRLRRARPVRLEHRLEPGRDRARGRWAWWSRRTPTRSTATRSRPLLEQVLPPARLAPSQRPGRGPRAVPLRRRTSATNSARDLLAAARSPSTRSAPPAACRRSSGRCTIDGDSYWDGGYLGNPALEPLLDQADDLLLVMVNPLHRAGHAAPQRPRDPRPAERDHVQRLRGARAERASPRSTGCCRSCATRGSTTRARYRPINLHLIRDDAVPGPVRLRVQEQHVLEPADRAARRRPPGRRPLPARERRLHRAALVGRREAGADPAGAERLITPAAPPPRPAAPKRRAHAGPFRTISPLRRRCAGTRARTHAPSASPSPAGSP